MSERRPYTDVRKTIDYLQNNEDTVIHGSITRGLTVIEPRMATDLHVDPLTGKHFDREAAISASRALVVATFYATVSKPSRQNGLIRGAAIKPLFNSEGRVVNFKLFASDAAKQIAEAVDNGSVDQATIQPTAYLLDARNLHEHGRGSEFRAATACTVLGSATVSLAHLELLEVALSDLAPPESDPDIKGYYEKYGYPEETPVRT